MSQHKDSATGKWYYTGKYKDLLGKRHDYKKRGFATKKEAKAAEEAFLAKIRGGYGRLRMSTLAELYNEDYSQAKDSTKILYKRIQKNFILPYFKDRYIDTIATLDIEKWIKQIAITPYGKNNALYAEKTIASIFDHMSGLFTFAVRHKLIGENPCAHTSSYKDPTNVREIINEAETNFWEVEEYKTFLKCIDDINHTDIYQFLFLTGMRIGEFTGLQWKHIDFDNSTINIKQAYNSTLRKITTPKTPSSIRSIDMSKTLRKILSDRYERSKKLDYFNDDYYVFGDIIPISLVTLRGNLKKDLENSTVKHITPHGFRHSHASYLLSNPLIPELLVANRLGDSVETLRKTYAHIYKKHRNTLIDYIDEINKML